MTLNSLKLVAVYNPAAQHTSRFRLVRRFQASAGAVGRALVERMRKRRQDRVTAAALQRLEPRELRDIGLVRLDGVHSTKYLRIYDCG